MERGAASAPKKWPKERWRTLQLISQSRSPESQGRQARFAESRSALSISAPHRAAVASLRTIANMVTSAGQKYDENPCCRLWPCLRNWPKKKSLDRPRQKASGRRFHPLFVRKRRQNAGKLHRTSRPSAQQAFGF